jgi:hypothetical protein
MRPDRVDSAGWVFLSFSKRGKDFGWHFREVSGFSRIKGGLLFRIDDVAMSKTRVNRGPGSDLDDPEWSDVQAIMQNILVDEGEQALGLEFEADASVTELVIIHVNDAAKGDAVGWLVHYFPASRRGSQVLMTHGCSGAYTTLEFLGGLADVPESALVPEDLIQSAAIHFLRCGEMNPSLTWAHYFATIRQD